MGNTKHYRTSEIAKAIGVHPNTVRLYEGWGWLPPVPRGKNGYRLYSGAHLEQMRLARIALRHAYVEGNIRKRAVSIVDTAAKGDLPLALEKVYEYIAHIKSERARAVEAIAILRKWVNRQNEWGGENIGLRRRDAAGLLAVTPGALRNWERNGLLEVPRDKNNGYHIYRQKEIDRAKVVRTLRKANYSLMSILRMFKAIDTDRKGDFYAVINTSQPDEDMFYATDRWIMSLAEIEKDAGELLTQINRMMNT